MGVYLKAVHDRLRSETTGVVSRQPLADKWLLRMLKEDGAEWWLRASKAKVVCSKLSIEYGEPLYYRDIYVWIFDLRWGDEALPPCVECKKIDQVGVHDYHAKNSGRRVCGLTVHYFVMSRRYTCHRCKKKAKEMKAAAIAAAQAAGLNVQEEGISS